MTTDILEAPVEQLQDNEPNVLIMANMTGDIQLTWEPQNAEKIKEFVRKKMAEGVTFFTLRKVVVDAVKVKRKVGPKGVEGLTNLVIDDATFEKMVKDLDDRDAAKLLTAGDAQMAKLRGGKRSFDVVKVAKSVEDVMASKAAMGVRKVVGG